MLAIEALLLDEAAHLLLPQDLIVVEAQHELAERMARDPSFDAPEDGERAECGEVASVAGKKKPTPYRMPMAEVIQIDAAVVRPTVEVSLKVTPAPRKPMPVMMPCAMRVGSVRTVSIGMPAPSQSPGRP